MNTQNKIIDEDVAPMHAIKDLEITFDEIVGDYAQVVKAFEYYLNSREDLVFLNVTPKYLSTLFSAIIKAETIQQQKKAENEIIQMLRDLKDIENTLTILRHKNNSDVYIPLDDCTVVASVSRETFYYKIIRIEKQCKSVKKALSAARYHTKYYNKIRDVAYLIHLLSQ